MTNLGARVLVAAGTLTLGICLMRATIRPTRVHARQPMRNFPAAISGWTGKDVLIEESVLKQLRVDDYLHRIYARSDGAAVQLYIGYFESQRAAEKLHSPKVCLPAAGWEAVRSDRISIELAGPTLVNEYVIEKDRQRQVVLFWYQARGRKLASEYWTKFWVMADALTRNRTDGALVRVISAVQRGEPEGRARSRAIEFIRTIDPYLAQFIPG